MIFIEKKLKTKYKYIVDDAFGKIIIFSSERMVDENNNAEYLDDVFMAIYEQHKHDTATKISGKIKDTNINYKFSKKNPWGRIKKNE